MPGSFVTDFHVVPDRDALSTHQRLSRFLWIKISESIWLRKPMRSAWARLRH